MTKHSKKIGKARFNKLSASQPSTLIGICDSVSSRIISHTGNIEEYVIIGIEEKVLFFLQYIKRKSKWYSSA